LPADAAPAWLWLAGLPARPAEFELESADAHYVARVCRANPGDRLQATDGEGTVATLEVLSARGEVRVRVAETRRAPRPAPVVIGCGAPEQDRADWMVEKLAELGVTDLHPLECERARWERFAGRADRLRRLTVGALRQSRSPWLLRLHEPATLGAWAAGLPEGLARSLADPSGERPEGFRSTGGEAAAIGPSPGFSAAETQVLREKGFRSIRLAAVRLRTETAAVVWAGLLGAMAEPGSAVDSHD
jgi:16S rRNA (uracil1498-N3)-methyltransferase